MGFSIDPDGVETKAINALVSFDGLRILEVGCGDGRMTWRYAPSAASVLALDINEEKILNARKATPRDLRDRVRFEAWDITTAPLPAGSFDMAVLSYSL